MRELLVGLGRVVRVAVRRGRSRRIPSARAALPSRLLALGCRVGRRRARPGTPGRPAHLCRSGRRAASATCSSGSVEMMISSAGWCSSAFMMLVNGSGASRSRVTSRPACAQLARASASRRCLRRSAARRPAPSCGADHGEAVRRRGRAALERLDQLRPPTVWLATTSTWRTGSSLQVHDHVLDRQAGPLLDPLDEVAAQPARSADTDRSR